MQTWRRDYNKEGRKKEHNQCCIVKSRRDRTKENYIYKTKAVVRILHKSLHFSIHATYLQRAYVNVRCKCELMGELM